MKRQFQKKASRLKLDPYYKHLSLAGFKIRDTNSYYLFLSISPIPLLMLCKPVGTGPQDIISNILIQRNNNQINVYLAIKFPKYIEGKIVLTGYQQN